MAIEGTARKQTKRTNAATYHLIGPAGGAIITKASGVRRAEGLTPIRKTTVRFGV